MKGFGIIPNNKVNVYCFFSLVVTGWERKKCKTDVPWGHHAPKHRDKVRSNSATMLYGKPNALRISADVFVLVTSDSSFLLLLHPLTFICSLWEYLLAASVAPGPMLVLVSQP